MYTIYATKQVAIIANVTAAANNNCNLTSTIEYYNRINHPDGRSALEDGVGPVTKEALAAEGWFDET